MTRLIAFLFLLLLPAAAFGEEVSLEQVVRALESPFAQGGKPGGIADFEAEFHQESRLASLDRVQRGGGTLSVRFDRSRSGASAVSFRWDYEKPARQEIVSDGRTLWVFLPENRQVIQSEIDPAQTRPDDPVAFLSGLGHLSRDFEIAWGSPQRDADGNWVLDLRPRRPSTLIQNLLVTVDRKAVAGAAGSVFPIRSTQVTDPSGNTTRIAFTNVRMNRGLPDTLFRFAVPAGVELIRPSEIPTGF